MKKIKKQKKPQIFLEEYIDNQYTFSSDIYDLLLLDRTTQTNIIFANTDYTELSEKFTENCPIPKDLAIPSKTHVLSLIVPSFCKTFAATNLRKAEKAEVFTDPWIVNLQIKLIDEQHFCGEDPFNTQRHGEQTIIYKKEPIPFPMIHNKTWQDYVQLLRMEICCGEGPYITTRYVASTGKFIPTHERVGILDRKMRVIIENTKNEEEFIEWTIRAIQSCYCYEYQGDSLFLVRKNILSSVIDYYQAKFSKYPPDEFAVAAASILSYNAWQMDGLLYFIPGTKTEPKIMDWPTKTFADISILLPGISDARQQYLEAKNKTKKKNNQKGTSSRSKGSGASIVPSTGASMETTLSTDPLSTEIPFPADSSQLSLF